MEVQWCLRTSARWILELTNPNHNRMVALYDGKVSRILFVEEIDGWRAIKYYIGGDPYECNVLLPHEYFTEAYQSTLIYPFAEKGGM
jgi:hypothetical protein